MGVLAIRPVANQFASVQPKGLWRPSDKRKLQTLATSAGQGGASPNRTRGAQKYVGERAAKNRHDYGLGPGCREWPMAFRVTSAPRTSDGAGVKIVRPRSKIAAGRQDV